MRRLKRRSSRKSFRVILLEELSFPPRNPRPVVKNCVAHFLARGFAPVCRLGQRRGVVDTVDVQRVTRLNLEAGCVVGALLVEVVLPLVLVSNLAVANNSELKANAHVMHVRDKLNNINFPGHVDKACWSEQTLVLEF